MTNEQEKQFDEEFGIYDPISKKKETPQSMKDWISNKLDQQREQIIEEIKSHKDLTIYDPKISCDKNYAEVLKATQDGWNMAIDKIVESLSSNKGEGR